MNPASPDFQRAFITVSYLAGARGDALLAPLVEPSAGARKLVAALAAEDRLQRARTLAGELEVLARRLSLLELGS